MAHSDETYRTEVIKYLSGILYVKYPFPETAEGLSVLVRGLHNNKRLTHITHDKYWWPTEVFERLKNVPEDPAKEVGKTFSNSTFVKVPFQNSAGEPIDVTFEVTKPEIDIVIQESANLSHVLQRYLIIAGASNTPLRVKEEGMKEGKLRRLLERYGKTISKTGHSGTSKILDLTHKILSLYKTQEIGEAMRLFGFVQGFLRACGYLTDVEIESDLKPRDPKQVTIDYTTHKGERKKFEIIPVAGTDMFTNDSDRPVVQWMFKAVDVEDGVLKTFCRKDVHSWTPNGDD
jgi:hypothetical protein